MRELLATAAGGRMMGVKESSPSRMLMCPSLPTFAEIECPMLASFITVDIRLFLCSSDLVVTGECKQEVLECVDDQGSTNRRPYRGYQ
jgi:hypothetical protein